MEEEQDNDNKRKGSSQMTIQTKEGTTGVLEEKQMGTNGFMWQDVTNDSELNEKHWALVHNTGQPQEVEDSENRGVPVIIIRICDKQENTGLDWIG